MSNNDNLAKARAAKAAKRAAASPGLELRQADSIAQRPVDSAEPELTLKPASEIPDKPKSETVSGVSSKAVSTELVPTGKSDPGEMVQKAQDRLRRRSLSMVRRLEELTEVALTDGPKCPTCGRGVLRAEDVRLRAILGALDRGGMAPQRSQDGPGTSSGPVLVFPPGTRIGIEVEAPAAIEMGVARRVDREIVLRRADEPGPGEVG